jgi:hypothetical protein
MIQDSLGKYLEAHHGFVFSDESREELCWIRVFVVCADAQGIRDEIQCGFVRIRLSTLPKVFMMLSRHS